MKIEWPHQAPAWNPPLAPRFGFPVFAGASVVAGLLAGTVKLGYLLDSPAASLAADHGHAALWQAGGLIDVIAVIVFLLVSVVLTVRPARSRATRKRDGVRA